MTHSLTAEAELPTDAPVIRVARRIGAAPARVWAAWTDPARVSDWWGPVGFSTTTSAHDLRPGGEWRFVMHGPDGADYGNRVVFETVKPPRLLTYAHYAADDPGNEPHFHARVDFAEDQGGTRVTLTMRCATLAERDRLAAFGVVEGGTDTLARFATLVESP